MLDTRTLNICIKHKLVNRWLYDEFRYANPKYNLPLIPYDRISDTRETFFATVNANFIKDKYSYEEHVSLCISNRLISNRLYKDYCADTKDIKLHPLPWVLSPSDTKTRGEFFSYIKSKAPNRDILKHSEYLSFDEHYNIFIKHELRTMYQYTKFRKNNPGIPLNTRPWVIGNTTKDILMKKVNDELGTTKSYTYQEYVDLCVNHKIITNQEYQAFRHKMKDLKLNVNPWRRKNITQKEFFDRIKEKCGIPINYLSFKQHIEICVENNLVNYALYKKFKMANPNIRLHSSPWVKKDMYIRQFFDIVKNHMFGEYKRF